MYPTTMVQVILDYNIQNQKLQMEDILQSVSNDHRSIYYAVQLKLMDVGQNIKLTGTSYKENDLKIAVADMLNHSYMLESIFEQAKIPHIYQLSKSIALNFNSIIAILLQRLDKATQKEISLLQIITAHQVEQNRNSKNDECVISHGSLMKEIKRNRLGGIHLFNENYSRYIEDQKILEQIKAEKQKRLQMKRLDILRQSVIQDLNHLTDVQEFPAKSDDIANYIIQAKDKNSMFNYVSYEPELQNILEFFQRSQNEANQFLMRKMRNFNQVQGQFSFADFQRDIQMKNFQFKKQVVDKMNVFTEKYREKQRQFQNYIIQKQNEIRQIQAKRNQKCDQQIQTQIIFEDFLLNFDKQIKQLTEKCHSYQSKTKEHINNNDKQNELERQLIERQAEIQKLNKKIDQQQASIVSVKQLLKDQKIKRINSPKQIDYKSQRAIPEPAPFVEKQRKVYFPSKQKNTQKTTLIQDNSSIQYNPNMRKTESVSVTDWKKREATDSASFLSFNDVERDKFGKQTLKSQKKITVKYQTKRSIQPESNTSKQLQIYESNGVSDPPKVSKDLYTKPQQKTLDNDRKRQKVDNKQAIKNENIDSKINSNTQSKKQSYANTPKQTSPKTIEGQLIKRQLKIISDSTNASLKQKKTPNSLKKIKFQHKQSLKNTSKSTKKETKQTFSNQSERESINHVQKQNVTQVQQNITNEIKAEKDGQILKNNQILIKNDLKKEKSAFQMYQVTEEEHEQQTAKPSVANSNRSSIKSFPIKESDLIQKLNRQLKKIENEKALALNRVYSLTIHPQQHKIMKDNKIQCNYTEESDIIIQNNNNKSHKKVIKLFDNLLQDGQANQIAAEKVRKWKKTMINHLKSNIVSQEQIDQMMSVIKGQSFTKGHTSIYQNAVTSIASISHHIRNSLPQIEQITNLSSKIKAPNMKKSKPQLVLGENEQSMNKQNSRLALLTQSQEQLQDLIKYQPLQNSFPQKFRLLHKNCEGGALCTHVTKYFESIMRHYESIKKKQRPSYALPVERIGNRTNIQQQALNKGMKQNQNNKSLRMDKSNQKTNPYRNYSLIKNRYSQQIMLPNINDNKMKNASHSIFKQQMI